MFDKYTKAELKEAVNEAEHKVKTECQEANRIEINRLKSNQEIEINKLNAQHEIALKEKEFDINHKNDDDKLRLTNELAAEKTISAVLTKQVEMLEKLVDVNADIIDIKELFNSLVNKLPNVNIGGNLTLGPGQAPKKEKE